MADIDGNIYNRRGSNVNSALRTRASLCVIAVVLTAANGRADGRSDFIARFSPVPEQQQSRFYTNRKIEVRNKSYKLEVPPQGIISRTLVDSWTVQMVNDASGNRKLEVLSSEKIGNRVGRVVFFNKDIRYVLENRDGTHTISEFNDRRDNELTYLQKNSTINQPTLTFNARQSLEAVLKIVQGSSGVVGSLTIQSVTKGTFHEKSAICVTASLEGMADDPKTKTRTNRKTTELNYFDESNTHAYLGTVANNEAGVDYPRAHKRYDLMEYHTPPGETHPVPKRYTRHIEFEGEPKLLEFETDYTGYEKYVPDPEEFRLEKRYGLATPVGPQGKDLVGKLGTVSSSRSWTWLYLLVGGILLGGLTVWYARRRRQV